MLIVFVCVAGAIGDTDTSIALDLLVPQQPPSLTDDVNEISSAATIADPTVSDILDTSDSVSSHSALVRETETVPGEVAPASASGLVRFVPPALQSPRLPSQAAVFATARSQRACKCSWRLLAFL